MMNSWSLGSELKLGRDGIVVLWDFKKRIYRVASTLRDAVLPLEQEQLFVKIMSVDTVSDAVDSVSIIQVFWPEQPQLYVKAANHLFKILKKDASDEGAKTACSNWHFHATRSCFHGSECGKQLCPFLSS